MSRVFVAEELMALQYVLNAKNLIQLVAKDDLKKMLGRSTDQSDAITMAVASAGIASGLYHITERGLVPYGPDDFRGRQPGHFYF